MAIVMVFSIATSVLARSLFECCRRIRCEPVVFYWDSYQLVWEIYVGFKKNVAMFVFERV